MIEFRAASTRSTPILRSFPLSPLRVISSSRKAYHPERIMRLAREQRSTLSAFGERVRRSRPDAEHLRRTIHAPKRRVADSSFGPGELLAEVPGEIARPVPTSSRTSLSRTGAAPRRYRRTSTLAPASTKCRRWPNRRPLGLAGHHGESFLWIAGSWCLSRPVSGVAGWPEEPLTPVAANFAGGKAPSRARFIGRCGLPQAKSPPFA